MDKKLIDTKHITVYITTLQIGVGILYITEHKALAINLGIIEINIRFSTKIK